MEINIRAAVAEDRIRIRPLQKEIAELHHEGRPDLFKNEPRYFTDESFAQRLQDPTHTVLIAETEQGEVVGYAFGWLISIRNHATYIDFDRFYIDDICVLKAHRGKGIGKKLFAACKDVAEKNGCKDMELGVWAFNESAIAFYRSCGMTDRVRRMQYNLE